MSNCSCWTYCTLRRLLAYTSWIVRLGSCLLNKEGGVVFGSSVVVLARRKMKGSKVGNPNCIYFESSGLLLKINIKVLLESYINR